MQTVERAPDNKILDGIRYAEITLLGSNSHLEIDKEILIRDFDLRNKDVLDFGCGMAGMSAWMAANLGAHVHGFDLDPSHVAIGEALIAKHQIPNVCVSQRNIIEDPLDKRYDLIILNDVIEHIRPEWISNILGTLIENNLKPEGTLFISYPPWEGPYASHMHRIIPIPWLQYFPQKWVKSEIKKRNQATLGRFDLIQEYEELNRMTHRMLMRHLQPFCLREIFRYSHTKLNRIDFMRKAKFRRWPFKHLITKEFIAFQRA